MKMIALLVDNVMIGAIDKDNVYPHGYIRDYLITHAHCTYDNIYSNILHFFPLIKKLHYLAMVKICTTNKNLQLSLSFPLC